ncbi:MAG: VWA domain-containing protein [Desulfobacteraceae bacterium]|nr:VWA domain-containing protein [Desulfobacteraceae bacterium]
MCLVSILSASICPAASFTATLLETDNDGIRTGRFYLRDDQYRIDVVEDGRQLNILVDRQSGQTRVLVPSEKVYIQSDNQDVVSLMNNPFEAHAFVADNYKAESFGEESIGSLVCEKRVYSTQGKKVMIAWVSTILGFPVKLENPSNNGIVELTDIEGISVDLSRFRVPVDYQKVDQMPIPLPVWAGDIKDAPVLKPPFEKRLAAGQMLRVEPVVDYDIHLVFQNPTSRMSNYLSVAFKDSRPLRRTSGYNLSANSSGTLSTHKESPSQADVIIVRANSGDIIVRADLAEAPEGIVLKKNRQKANTGRQFPIDHKKPTRFSVTDVPDDGVEASGELILFTTITTDLGGGTIVYDKKEFHREPLNLKDGAVKIWQFEAEHQIGTIDVRVSTGALDLRLEQPEIAGVRPPSWPISPVETYLATSAGQAAQGAVSGKTLAAQKMGPGRMVLVLDASGSMWGRIRGQPKISIARRVLSDLIDRLPGDMKVGLTVYGHRRKGDCRDIETVVPVGTLAATTLKHQIDAVIPKGKTPLSAAVQRAAQELRYTEERAIVVLISDGLETCDMDPCELAGELATDGVDITVHVIGLQIKKEDQGYLECLAEKTGGLFLTADNSKTLGDALSRIVAKVQGP